MNALGMISTVVMARLLVPADFGVVAIGMTVLAIVQAVTNMSLGQALIHLDEPDDRHLDCAWTLNMLRGLLLGGIIAALGPFLADLYGDERLKLVLAIFGGSVFISGLANTKLAMLERDLLFHQRFIMQTSSKLVLVIISIAVAWQTRSYVALVAGTVASQVTQVLVSYAVAPRIPRLRLKEAGALLSFSWWLTLTEIMATINVRFEPLVIGKFLTIHTLGLFTVATNLSSLPTRETTRPLSATLFPAFRQLRDQPERLRRAYTRAQTLISAIALPCGILMAVLAKPLVLLVLGEKWSEVVPILQVLAIVAASMTLGAALQPLAMAQNRNDLLFRRSLQGLLTRVPLTICGLIFGGLQGYLIVRSCLVVIVVLFNKFIVKEIIGIPVVAQLQHNWRTIAAALCMALLGFVIVPVFDFGPSFAGLIAQIAVVGGICALTYLALLFGLWALQDRPEGPENDVLDAINIVHRKALKVIGILAKQN